MPRAQKRGLRYHHLFARDGSTICKARRARGYSACWHVVQAFKAPARPVTALAALPFESALPLSTLASTADPTASPTANLASASSTRLVELHNCTLEVPPVDFMALLTLATDGTNSSVRACMDLDTVAHAARLMTGIQVSAGGGTLILLVMARRAVAKGATFD